MNPEQRAEKSLENVAFPSLVHRDRAIRQVAQAIRVALFVETSRCAAIALSISEQSQISGDALGMQAARSIFRLLRERADTGAVEIGEHQGQRNPF